MSKYRVWECKIIISDDGTPLPHGFDFPPRMAAQKAIEDAGFEVLLNASGWGGTVSEADEQHLGKDNDVYYAGTMDADSGTEH